MSESKKSFFVVTVPHATCPPREDEEAWKSTGNHACDFSGPPAGQELKSALERRGRIVKILEAPVPRTVLDMNRKWSRSSEWRRRVASTVTGGAECLIDAHSYPAQYSSFGGADIVLLTEGEPETWQLEIEERLSRAGFRCSHTARHDTADLVTDVHSRGVPAVLIEFSEGLNRTRLKTAADSIAEYLCLPTKIGECNNGKCGQFAEIRSALVVRNNLVIGGPSNYTLSRNFGGSDGDNIGAPNGQKRSRKERELEEESQLPESGYSTTEEEEILPEKEKKELLWTHVQVAAGTRLYRCEGLEGEEGAAAAPTFPTRLSVFHDTIEMATRALGNHIFESEETTRSRAYRAKLSALRRKETDVERAEEAAKAAASAARAAALPSPEYVVRAYETLAPTKWIVAPVSQTIDVIGSDLMSAAKETGAVGVIFFGAADASLKKIAFAPHVNLPGVLARVPDFGLAMSRPWLTAIAPSLNLVAKAADDWHGAIGAGPAAYRETNRARLWSPPGGKIYEGFPPNLAENFAAVEGKLLAYDNPSRAATQEILSEFGRVETNRSAQRAAAAVAMCGDGLGAGDSLMKPWLAPKQSASARFDTRIRTTAEWIATTGGLEILCFAAFVGPREIGAIATAVRLRPNLVVFCGAGPTLKAAPNDELARTVLDACGHFVNDLHEMSRDNVLLVYDEDARDPRIAEALGLGRSRVELPECRTPRFFAYRYEEPLLFRHDVARPDISRTILEKLSNLMPVVVRRHAPGGRRLRQPLDVVVKFADRRGQRLAQILGSAREYAAVVRVTQWLADREPIPMFVTEENVTFTSPYAQVRPRAAPFFFEALACAIESGDVPAAVDVAAVLCSGALGGISMVEKRSAFPSMVPEEWRLVRAPAVDDDANIARLLGSNAGEVLVVHEGKITRPWTTREVRAAAEYRANFQHLMTKLTSARRIDSRLTHSADECIAHLLVLLFKAIGTESEGARIPTADAAAATLAAPLLRRGGVLAATTCVGLFGLATGLGEFQYLTQLCIECAARDVTPALIAKSTAESALTLSLMDPAMEWRAGVPIMIETAETPAVLNLATLCAAYRCVDALRWNVPEKIAAELKKNVPRVTVYSGAPEVADPEFEFGAAQDPDLPLPWTEVETEREEGAGAGPTFTLEVAGPAPLKVVRLDDALAFESAAAPGPKLVGGPPDLFENEEQYRARALMLRPEGEKEISAAVIQTFAKSALDALIDRCAVVGGCSVAAAPWLSWHAISFAKVTGYTIPGSAEWWKSTALAFFAMHDMSSCVRRCAKLGLVNASDFGQTFADPARGPVSLARVAKEWVFPSRNVPSRVIVQFLAGLEEGSRSEIFVSEKEIEGKYGREMLDWLIKFEATARNVGKDRFYRAFVVDSLAVLLGMSPKS